MDELNYVSPWFYSVNGNGDVTNTVQPNVNALLAQHGVHNLPMLKNLSTQANFHDALANPIKRGQIITAMLSAVQANNYDGITVDFEGISPEDGQYLTLFMRELYGNMKAMNKLGRRPSRPRRAISTPAGREPSPTATWPPGPTS